MSNSKNPSTTVLIIAGGSGTRFWPLSTNQKPKQFLKLGSDRTMIQRTVDNLESFIPYNQIFIVTAEDHTQLVQKQIPSIPAENIIGEPMGRDTAAAIMLGASVIEDRMPNSIMIVLPADHIIQPVDRFIDTLRKAIILAKQDKIVTLGVKPAYPATAFGYIRTETEHTLDDDSSYYSVAQFVEKPPLEKARQYMQAGNYVWNSGIFIWKTQRIMDEILRFLPETYHAIHPLVRYVGHSDWRLNAIDAFESLSKISIDYAVMERAEDIVLLPLDVSWNDVGNWLSLKQLLSQDSNHNWVQATYLQEDSHHNIILSDQSSRPILTLGISNSIIVVSEKGVLVCAQDQVDQIKKLVEQLDQL
jgi:mannose-1-phosphate guanylyltransferase